MQSENANGIVQAPGIEFVQKTLDNKELQQVDESVINKKDFVTFEVSGWVTGSESEDSTLHPTFYVANVSCFLIEARMRHTSNGGGDATLKILKVASGDTTVGLGRMMIDSAFTLSAGAHTVQRRTATTTLSGLQLDPGDAMKMYPFGTLTSLRNVTVTVLLGINHGNVPTGASI